MQEPLLPRPSTPPAPLEATATGPATVPGNKVRDRVRRKKSTRTTSQLPTPPAVHTEQERLQVFRDFEERWSEGSKSFDMQAIAVYKARQPSTAYDGALRRLLERLVHLAESHLSGVSVRPFGSFVSGVHSQGSDLDASLEILQSSPFALPPEPTAAGSASRSRSERKRDEETRKKAKVKVLRKFEHVLRRAGMQQMELIPFARVPLIKFVDPTSRVQCDVCVGNDGVYKSAVLRYIMGIDSRISPLYALVKAWAKAHDINNPAAGTLNSFALTLLVIFHLQQCRPPILPPLYRLLAPSAAAAEAELEEPRAAVTSPAAQPAPQPPSQRAASDTCRDLEQCEQRAAAFAASRYGAGNSASIGQLLASFFGRMEEALQRWRREGVCVSAYAAEWRPAVQWPAGKYALMVEDPFCYTENCARSVLPGTLLRRIEHAVSTAASALANPPQSSQAAGEVALKVFGDSFTSFPVDGNTDNARKSGDIYMHAAPPGKGRGKGMRAEGRAESKGNRSKGGHRDSIYPSGPRVGGWMEDSAHPVARNTTQVPRQQQRANQMRQRLDKQLDDWQQQQLQQQAHASALQPEGVKVEELSRMVQIPPSMIQDTLARSARSSGPPSLPPGLTLTPTTSSPALAPHPSDQHTGLALDSKKKGKAGKGTGKGTGKGRKGDGKGLSRVNHQA